MSTREVRTSRKARLKRDAPRRAGPVRNVTMAFRGFDGGAETPPYPPAHDESASRARRDGGAETPPAHDATAASARRTGGAREGVVEKAVATAYRVFEEYMQRGRQAAERHHKQDDTGGPMKYERQVDPAAMAMQYWTNMAQAWFGAMAPFLSYGMPGAAGGGPGRGWDFGGNAPPPPFAGGYAGGVGQRLAMAVHVSSAHPTEVRVSLGDQRVAQKALSVQDLLTTEGAKLPASAVRFEYVAAAGPLGEHLLVHVEVPKDQHPGVYAGPIMDKDRTGVGRLDIVIHRR